MNAKKKKTQSEEKRADIACIRADISFLCERTGLAQADIARLLGVSPKTLSAWLSGLIVCRHDRVLALAVEALAARLTKR